jgi:hypothetical protein
MKTSLYLIGGIAGFFAMRMIHGSPEAKLALAIAITLVCGLSYGLGWLIGLFTAKQVNVDGDNADVFAWSGMVLWIFPIFGLINSAIVWQWASLSSSRSVRYQVLSAVACIGSIGMVVFGAITGIEYRTGETFTFGLS